MDGDIGGRPIVILTAEEPKDELPLRLEVHGPLEPEDSRWANTSLLGAMLPRQTALAHPVLPEVFEVAECVVKHDERVATFLATELKIASIT